MTKQDQLKMSDCPIEKRVKVVFANSYHGTQVVVYALVGRDGILSLSKGQVRKVRDGLCDGSCRGVCCAKDNYLICEVSGTVMNHEYENVHVSDLVGVCV